MSTLKQLDANRRNAQKSTGPRTTDGKARSAANALKHGLTAQHQLIPSESEAGFNDLARALRAEHDPQTPTEQLLVDQLISAAWRLQRIRVFETRYFQEEVPAISKEFTGSTEFLEILAFDHDAVRGPKSTLSALARHESRLERSFYRALHELQRLRSLRPPEEDLQNEPNFPLTPMESISPDVVMQPAEPPISEPPPPNRHA